MRVIDVLQVLMQDPRVAFKQAELIAAEEQRKDVARRVDAVDQKVKKRSVVKSESTEKQQPVKQTRRSKGHITVKKPDRTMHIDISA